MNISQIENRLEKKKVKPTPNRILVYKQLTCQSNPACLADLERAMPTMDKSSIFRVLTLFLEHDIAHAFEDGRGIINYELCGDCEACSHSDSHIHFYCESCHKSFCMPQLPLPDIVLPEGFSPHSVSFVIKGECPDCRKKHQHI